MLLVSDYEVSKSKNFRTRMGVNESVLEDIDNLLCKKSYTELETLQKQVEKKLADGGPIDVEYWEALMKSLVVWKSKATVRELHHEMLKKRTTHEKSDASAKKRIIIKSHTSLNSRKAASHNEKVKNEAARSQTAENASESAHGKNGGLDEGFKSEFLEQMSDDEEELKEGEITVPKVTINSVS